MKNLFLSSLLAFSTLLFSCSKQAEDVQANPSNETQLKIDKVNNSLNQISNTNCGGCDVLIPPGDPGQGGGTSNPTRYTGGSSCSGGAFTVVHGNQLQYSISYKIVNGALQDVSFSHSFLQPGLPYSGTLQSYSVNFDGTNVSVNVSYKTVTSTSLPDQNGGSQTVTQTSHYNYLDLFNTCNNTVSLQY